jgi:hypothetical protein
MTDRGATAESMFTAAIFDGLPDTPAAYNKTLSGSCGVSMHRNRFRPNR